MKKLILISGFLLLNSCAAIQKRICDCAGESHASAVKVEKSAKPVRVNPADFELTAKMQAAMDDYVFKDEKTEFMALCADPRFDCTLNDKRFPKEKKKIRRKIPPFMSGSKMGVVNNERILLKYNFYPGP